ncbi:Abhydrolase_3 domain-containing protein [Cephalotus follicularis]|uniref:Abhydrolase_3 domain-containing protein n=1 Tax=Cephalotus follicularis TaxID=3775 RepID=A0A1Q3CZD2_CEPFO|nr:Abhydrolase_3 domain-containing protein [Cephalotus follicularis]
MPSVAVKLYSVFFKFLLKHRLQNRIQTPLDESSKSFGVTTRSEESVSAPNPSFADGVATKDIHIDPFTSLSIRIFLPEAALSPPEPDSKPNSKPKRPIPRNSDPQPRSDTSISRRNSYGTIANYGTTREDSRRNSYGGSTDILIDGVGGGGYRGYSPLIENNRKLPVIVQFHGGGWVSGSKDSVANDFFCRRIAKLLDVIVLAVGYRLAPENKYPAAFDDGLKVLNWLGKQANLAECSKSMWRGGGGGGGGMEFKKGDANRHIVDAFGASMVEPWLAAHGDPSRCILLGVSCGANIADYVARKAVEAGRLLDPVKVVAQVLMYPFFIGSVPTHSEIRLANSYFYDKAMCMLAWKLFLPEGELSLDHPAANPLVPGRGPPLKLMPPTLTVVAEHDWMRDRAIAYSEELRKVNVDAPVLEYKDAVHEFATLDMLLKTPQAQACAEDIAIWVKKYISLRGHEFSY